jgi:hypothetical protein
LGCRQQRLFECVAAPVHVLAALMDLGAGGVFDLGRPDAPLSGLVDD